MKYYDCIVIGGGAAGFFSAIQHKEKHPKEQVLILEKSKNLLAKVRISGGGRCNVTHHCFVPKELVKNYPRGSKELLGPFFTCNPEHIIQWFKKESVLLKVEKDGRMFPITDDSMTIVHCFLNKAEKLGIEIKKSAGLKTLEKKEGLWEITTLDLHYQTKKLIIATGSSQEIWEQLEELKINIIPPVPSLFSFICNDARLEHLAGISFSDVQIQVKDTKLIQKGPLLITHKGFSGPSILKCSAWGARILHEKNYQFKITINFASEHQNFQTWLENKKTFSKKMIKNTPLHQIPSRFWEILCADVGENRWADTKNETLEKIYNQIFHSEWLIEGKDTNKEEFVTAGGIDLKEIQWKTMELKNHPGLYAVGEVLDIDGITGGFNFQSAWTTAWLAGNA